MALTPQPVEGSSSGLPEPYQLQFLSAEERSTALLMGYFTDARLELETFIRSGNLTVSDQTYYRKLLDEVDRVATLLNTQGTGWVSSVIPSAYSAGWRTASTIVVSQAAIEALSRDTLSLITATTNGIRQAIRQSIAMGILEGLSPADLRTRILASGLGNIPHWPSVEYRAGVIARTETMRAFNGGILDSVTKLGAHFVRWIVSPDEAVCRICGPRSRKVYRLPGVAIGGPTDPWGPAAATLPKIPAHPRCRCTIRAEFRGPNDEIVPAGATPEPPGLPTDAMGGDLPPELPPSAGDFPGALASLDRDFTRYMRGEIPDLQFKAFWRSLDVTDDMMRTIAGLNGGTLSAAVIRVREFMFARYGIDLYYQSKPWRASMLYTSLRALEQWRAVAPRYVVDSPYLKVWGEAPPGARRMSGTRSAEMYAEGYMRPNYSGLKSYEKVIDGYKIGYGDTQEFVFVHELAHAVENRFGANFQEISGFYPAIEYGGVTAAEQANVFERIATNKAAYATAKATLLDPWAAIRSQTQAKIAPTVRQSDVDAAIAKVKLLEEELAAATSFTSSIEWRLNYARQTVERLQTELLEAANPTGEYWPTDYARKNAREDFAESAAIFILNPDRLRKYSPARYEFLKRTIFGTE